MLNLIPAIDLKDGLVVCANAGNRTHYQPLATPLFPNAKPNEVIARLYQHHQFRTFYLADLNAIMQTGDNRKTIVKILEAYPDISCWVDIGIRQYPEYIRLKQTHPNIVPIIPTETLLDIALLETITEDDYILSLDFKDQRLLGAKEILQQNHHWPDTVIALSLDAVGGNSPDFAMLNVVLQHNHKTRRIILGGGVRDAQDLRALDEAGADGVLLATALYNGSLP